MNTYALGQEVRVYGSFRNSSGNLANPSIVHLKLKTSSGHEYTYTFGAEPALTNDSPGVFSYRFVPNRAGKWSYRWVGSGTIRTAEETFFTVTKSLFSSP